MLNFSFFSLSRIYFFIKKKKKILFFSKNYNFFFFNTKLSADFVVKKKKKQFLFVPRKKIYIKKILYKKFIFHRIWKLLRKNIFLKKKAKIVMTRSRKISPKFKWKNKVERQLKLLKYAICWRLPKTKGFFRFTNTGLHTVLSLTIGVLWFYKYLFLLNKKNYIFFKNKKNINISNRNSFFLKNSIYCINFSKLFLKNVIRNYTFFYKRKRKYFYKNLIFIKNYEISFISHTFIMLFNNNYNTYSSFLLKIIRFLNWRTYDWKKN